jgi:hypothetical protein
MFDASSRKLSKTRISAGIFCSASGVFFLLLFLAGCGVVGDILPPALNLPIRATDMTAVEHDKVIVITFKLPATTTEGTLIRHQPEIDLRIGPAPAAPNDDKAWAAHTTRIPTTEPHADTLAGPWANQKVAISVRLLNDRGKDAGWSPLVILTVVPPVEAPKDLVAEPQPAGVHLKWTSSAPRFRVFRHTPANPGYEQIATPEKPEYDDAVDFGKEYLPGCAAAVSGAK